MNLQFTINKNKGSTSKNKNKQTFKNLQLINQFMPNILPQNSEILFYSWQDGDIKIEVIFQDETVWLSQKQMAMLFGVWVPTISKHLKNIFESWELDEKVVVSILEIPTKHWAISWKTQNVEIKFYYIY